MFIKGWLPKVAHMGVIRHVPLHAPRAAPGTVAALRASDHRNGGLVLSLAWLLVGSAFGLTAAGAHRGAVEPRPIQRIAAVAANQPLAAAAVEDVLAWPHDPTAARSWPGILTTTLQMQPIPAFVGLDDPPGLGPAPAVDPAVSALLAQLLDDAKGSPSDLRPGLQAEVALKFALAQVGRPYVWGATGPDSYDCSGLTWQSYAQAGVALPRVAAAQYGLAGTPVAIADLLPGDLVFFATAAWDPGAVHHVGMYVGHGLMVDAPHPGAYVRVEPVTAAGYVGAVRIVPVRPAEPAPTATPSPTATPTGAGAPPTPAGATTPSTTSPAAAGGTPSDPPTPSAADPTPSAAAPATPDPTPSEPAPTTPDPTPSATAPTPDPTPSVTAPPATPPAEPTPSPSAAPASAPVTSDPATSPAIAPPVG
jgi:cell wall-associated NlpC family hydrolase